MQATDTGKLDIPSLPENATTAHVFPDITTSLILVPKLCDANCLVTFQKSHVTVYNPEGKMILVGRHDPQTRLWLVPLHTPTGHALSAYHQETKPALTPYLHACAGFPTKVTWTKAIDNGQYITWTGLIIKLVRKHLPLSEETTLGHLRLLRQGIRPTATDPTPNLAPSETPTVRAHRQKRHNHNVGAQTIKLDTLQGMISADLTGSLPITSARVHNYIFLLYDYD